MKNRFSIYTLKSLKAVFTIQAPRLSRYIPYSTPRVFVPREGFLSRFLTESDNSYELFFLNLKKHSYAHRCPSVFIFNQQCDPHHPRFQKKKPEINSFSIKSTSHYSVTIFNLKDTSQNCWKKVAHIARNQRHRGVLLFFLSFYEKNGCERDEKKRSRPYTYILCNIVLNKEEKGFGVAAAALSQIRPPKSQLLLCIRGKRIIS